MIYIPRRVIRYVTIFCSSFGSSQVNSEFTSSFRNFVYECPDELPNDLILSILGNKENLKLRSTHRLVYSPFTSEIKLCQWQSKSTQNQMSKVSGLVQFCLISFYFLPITLPMVVSNPFRWLLKQELPFLFKYKFFKFRLLISKFLILMR